MILKYQQQQLEYNMKVLIGYKFTRLGPVNEVKVSSMFTTIKTIPQNEKELEVLGETVLRELKPKRLVDCSICILSISQL